MNVSVKTLNSRIDDDLFGLNILKTCIGGAFYNWYVKSNYLNEDMLRKT